MSHQKMNQTPETANRARTESSRPKEKGKTAVSRPIQFEDIQRAIENPASLMPVDAVGLHQTIGNQAVGRLLIQPKLTVGPVGDKYEQEADAVAKQVVSQLSTTNQPTAQRQEEEELQMKPANFLQRQEEDELQLKPIQRLEEDELQLKPVVQRQEEDELQLKPVQRQEEDELQLKPVVQRQEEDELQMMPIQRQEEDELQMMPVTAVQRQSGTGYEGGEVSADIEQSIQSARGGGQSLADNVRTPMENAFGADFSGVKVHTDPQSNTLNQSIQARAFTTGQDIFFRQGEYNPGSSGGQELLAHELTHVVQQTGSQVRQKPAESRTDKANSEQAPNQIDPNIAVFQPIGYIRRAPFLLQRSLSASYPVTHGGFEVDMQTREGAINTPPTHSGLDGYIRFVPNPTAPNSNSIALIQIVKLTDLGAADVNPASMPAAQAPRGALGDPGLRTQDDAVSGVEGGFFTDVHHRPNASSPGVPQGSDLSPRYNFQPAAAGAAGTVGQTTQPAQYGGGTGGVVGQTPGFKRSNDPADIRSAALYDTPGVPDPAWNLDFSFETVARGEDTMINYGTVEWGFGLRAGKVINEQISVHDDASTTFDEALERHRDFYVHEPVTFYFDFDKDQLNATEVAKIDTFLDYLQRNLDVMLSLEGYADLSGGASDYNLDLSLRRTEGVKKALLDKGIDESRIDDITIGRGASSSATTDAGTGDQGGDAAVGADQSREANRWANRRVVLTFERTASPGGGTP